MARQPVNRELWTAGEPPAVLVVDDDPAMGSLLAEMLESGGFAPRWCASPEQALEAAQPGRFEAGVIDLKLPGMDGLSLIDRLQASDPELQCLVLTGHASFDSALEGLRHGVFDYLCKADLRNGSLERRVRQAVERARLERDRHELVVRLGTLAASSAALAAEHDQDRLLAQLVASARGLCRAEAARVLLVEAHASGGWTVVDAAGEAEPGLLGARLEAGSGGLAARALETGDVLVDLGPGGAEHERPVVERFGASRPGLIVAPFEHRAVLGVLMVAGARRRSFGHGERDALAALARQGGVAIDNARQHQRAALLELRLQELERRLGRDAPLPSPAEEA